MLAGSGGGPVVERVGEDPVGPVAALAGAGARGVEVLRERRGEAVEGLPERLEPVAGDVVGGLGAVGEALDARERERHEVDGPGVAPRREAREVARRGDVGHAVAPRRQALGELQEREQVAERQPRAEHDAQRPRQRGGWR